MNIEDYASKHPKTKPGIILPENMCIIDALPENSKILDIGCAEGITIQQLRSTYPQKYVLFGVDLSKIRIETALDKKIDRAEFRTGDAQNLAFEDKLFDFVIASQVIEHVPDDASALQEIGRVLVSSGKFQIDTVYKKKWAKYIYKSPAGWALDPTHVREYTDIDFLISRFPSSLRIDNIQIKKCYRKLNLAPFLAFLPDWVKVRIPGYFIIFLSGHKA